MDKEYKCSFCEEIMTIKAAKCSIYPKRGHELQSIPGPIANMIGVGEEPVPVVPMVFEVEAEVVLVCPQCTAHTVLRKENDVDASRAMKLALGLPLF